MSDNRQYDVLLIGAGPSGSSAAALLAEYRYNVLLIEREKFPRYHIGESLLPFTHEPLKRLGLIERMRASAFIKKYSVQFVSTSGKASEPFYFNTRYDDDVAQTWQVLRSEFDQMLLDHARDKGANVVEETKVLDLLRDGDRVTGVRVRQPDGTEAEYRAPITLDCSGKESFTASRNRWRVPDPELNKVAVWTYYKGAKRDEGIDEGTTTVAFLPEKGWFWHIPLHDDRVSVGVVAEGKYLTRDGVKTPKDIFHREVTQNKWIEEYLAPGKSTGDYYITNEFSYHSRHCGCEGLLLLGDAFCFLDPVFSSGLMLALKSGVMAADAVHAAIEANDFSPTQFEDYAATLREGIENMRKLVYVFYHPNFTFRDLIEKHPDLAGDITDCLSGDVNKDFSRLWTAVEEFAPIPEKLPYGMPKAPEKAMV